MSSQEAEVRPRASSEFLQSSILEAVVPAASEIDIEEQLQAWDGEVSAQGASILPFVPQRQFLLLDEHVPVYVVLRTPAIPENTLKSCLSRLAINLEAYATGIPAPVTTAAEGQLPSPSLQTTEMLFSETIRDSDDPVICASNFQASEDEEAQDYLFIFWKVVVPIGRPKARIQKLEIYFAPSASLKPADNIKTEVLDDEYLPSHLPAAPNLLQAFENDPSMHGVRPRLSASRITKVAPTAPVARELLRPLKSGPRRLFRTAPSILWRAKFSRVPASPIAHTVVACLDFEITRFADCDVSLDEVNVTLSNGKSKMLGSLLPILCKQEDQVTLLFELTPGPLGDSTTGSEAAYIMEVHIAARALISESCRPKIGILWRSSVEADTFGANKKASNILSSPPMLGPDTLPSNSPRISHDRDIRSNTASGISITISGPRQVRVGEEFEWELFVVNRSDRAQRLAIVVIPKRKRIEVMRHEKKGSRSSANGVKESEPKGIADAILDEGQVFITQRNAQVEPAELVCLSTDIRISSLPTAACYTAELKFIALKAGVLRLDCLRVVDIMTQEATDVRDLPDILAVDGEDMQ